MSDAVISWRPVTLAPAVIPEDVLQVLASVDTLRGAWERAIAQMTPEEFAEARQRSLRRHAIETGIIERLYDIDWGVTEALVAEGISADVVARNGGATDEALIAITDQLDALQLVCDLATGERALTVYAVRELHASITRSQATYEATDQSGRKVSVPLRHGDWKSESNHVRRPDGTLLEYAPAEQVQSEMDRLIDMFEEQESTLHPVVLSAWLHHRFISIHPFQDGNGRVARALVLLVLLRRRYAPLVVDRTRREDYLQSLDKANAGDLWALTRLFSRLEIEVLRAELERPSLPTPQSTQPQNVAKAYVERLLRTRAQEEETLRDATNTTAAEVQRRTREWLVVEGDALRAAFLPIDRGRSIFVDSATPDDGERAQFWRGQIVRAANALDFFTNLRDGTWWCHLKVSVLGEVLRYLPVVQKVGHGETGVLALSVFAEFVEPPDPNDPYSRPGFTAALEVRPEDSLTFTAGEDIDRRLDELYEVLERTLALAVDALGRRLS